MIEAPTSPVLMGAREPGAEARARTRASRAAAESQEFEEFYSACHVIVYRSAYAFCGNYELSWDATQEAFARAYSRWFRLRRQTWLTGWVVATALNYCRRAARRDRSRPLGANADLVMPPPSVEGSIDLISALQTLSARQRQAVVLHYLLDQPVEVVAELMNVSSGAVKKHLARARETLRVTLRAESEVAHDHDGG